MKNVHCKLGKVHIKSNACLGSILSNAQRRYFQKLYMIQLQDMSNKNNQIAFDHLNSKAILECYFGTAGTFPITKQTKLGVERACEMQGLK